MYHMDFKSHTEDFLTIFIIGAFFSPVLLTKLAISDNFVM